MKMSDIKESMYPELYRLAQQIDAPITPNRTDEEALMFLSRIRLNIFELKEMDDIDEKLDLVPSLADDCVPVATYAQYNAFSQLGLYNYDDYSGGLVIGAESDAQSQMENTVMMTLYLFAEGALFQFADRQFAGMD